MVVVVVVMVVVVVVVVVVPNSIAVGANERLKNIQFVDDDDVGALL